MANPQAENGYTPIANEIVGKDCDGYASPVKDLQTEICNLLSSIWEYKKCDSWEFIIRLSGVIDKENKE